MTRLTGMAGCLLLLTLLIWPPYVQAHNDRTAEDKVVHAVRAQDGISIDARLDDAAWAYASPIRDFTQREPIQDAPPTETTEIRIAYDDEAVYFGIMMYDSEPDKIVKRLARRDRPWDADYISISIDPYHDHRIGFYFTVSASGIEGDGLMYNDTRRDSDWDSVWDSSVRITEEGWVAEVKIPYHTIRFIRQEIYTWGLNFQRSIFRKNERDYWMMIRRGENGWLYRFGHIEGIENISPPMGLFYSRRIGRSPSGSFDTRDGDAVLLERPLATRIISAAKMTGRTQSGITIGLVSAVTGKEYATLVDTVQDVRFRDQIEPRATYKLFVLNAIS
jgi:hypothetical protein